MVTKLIAMLNPRSGRSFLIAVAVLSVAPAATRAEQTAAFNPRIQSVIVYPDRALVTRSAAVKLERGKHVLVFKEASPNLEPASLRAFSGHADVIIQGINSYVERSVATRNPEVRKLEDTLDDLERRQEALELQRERLSADLRGTDQYASYFSRMIADGSTGRASAEETAGWTRARGFLNERRGGTARELLSVDAARSDVQEKIGIARRDLERLKTDNEKSLRIVEITLNAREAAETQVGFSYMIGGASWNVSYGMYLRGEAVAVEYFGNIRQKTGEDWKNIVLRLSTSTPSHGAARPPLLPLAVNVRRVQTELQVQQELKESEETESEAEPAEPDVAATDGEFTAVEGDGTSLVFRVARSVSMESGERSHRVSVANFETAPKDFHYRLAPGVRKSAILAARIANTQSFPLLAGMVDVYRTSGFIGRSTLKYVPPGTNFLMGFGAEESVRTKRSVKRYLDESGVLSSRKRFHTTVTLEIKNDGEASRRISLFERVPVSELEEVTTSILPETTAGYKEEKKNSGLLQWDFDLPPGATRTFTVSFRVDVPASFSGEFYGN